jgi:hypothetical protein
VTPDWHDYPTGPGLWVRKQTYIDDGMTDFTLVHEVVVSADGIKQLHSGKMYDMSRTVPGGFYTYRYYGPLPHDPQDQGETN